MIPPVNYSSDCNQMCCKLTKLRMATKIYDNDSSGDLTNHYNNCIVLDILDTFNTSIFFNLKKKLRMDGHCQTPPVN